MPLYPPSGGGLNTFTFGTWRTTNVPASSTVSPNRATGLANFWTAPRDGVLSRIAWNADKAVDVTSTPLLIVASIAGGADVPLYSVTNADGISSGLVIASPPVVLKDESVQIRYVTDAGWTILTQDPSVDIEFEVTP